MKEEERVIQILNEEIPLTADPWQEMANRAGMTETEFLAVCRKLKDDGKIRRIGAVLRHREVGFKANAMFVGIVPAEQTDNAGALFTANAAVTHCYTRKTADGWPFNFYAMLHAENQKDLEELVGKLASELKISEWQLLWTVREWKKESLKYSYE